jgi:hypothetical protein
MRNGNGNGYGDIRKLASDDLMQASAAAAGTFAKLNEPWVKAASRVNSEMMALASQRMQAYLGIPNRLATCRTPHDLMTEQVRFWQTAFQQYGAASRSIAAAMTGAQAPAASPGNSLAWPTMPGLPAMPFAMMPFGMPFAFGDRQDKPATRDFITFPEPKAASEGASGNRRVA